MRLRLPRERPAEPLKGYKLANPVLAEDCGRIGFAGVAVGGARPYGVVDEARCVYGRRHRCPALRCDCGFYCLHTFAEALALARSGAHRRAAILEVTVLGAYIRFERGMRYARQRVRVARIGPCGCGRLPEVFVDAGWGWTGWRALTGACTGCAAGRGEVSFEDFVRIGGGRLRVLPGHRDGPREGAGESAREGTADGLWEGGRGGPRDGTPPGPADAAAGPRPAGRAVSGIAAEAAVLQARLDRLQGQLGQLGRLTGEA